MENAKNLYCRIYCDYIYSIGILSYLSSSNSASIILGLIFTSCFLDCFLWNIFLKVEKEMILIKPKKEDFLEEDF